MTCNKVFHGMQWDPIAFHEKLCCMSYILALMDLMMVKNWPKHVVQMNLY